METAAQRSLGYRRAQEHFDRCGVFRAVTEPPVLSNEEQDELLVMARAGDAEARHALALSNMRLARSVAKKYCAAAAAKSFLDFEDLVMAGYEGLLRACDTFDMGKLGQVAFSTYATYWLRQAMVRELSASTTTARIPASVTQDVFALLKAMSKAEQETGVQATLDDALRIAQGDPALSKKAAATLRALSIVNAVSIHAPVGEDKDSVLGDLVALSAPTPEDEALLNDTVSGLRAALDALPEKQRAVLKRRFGFGTGVCETLEEIGRDLGVCGERIRQIEAAALGALREALA